MNNHETPEKNKKFISISNLISAIDRISSSPFIYNTRDILNYTSILHWMQYTCMNALDEESELNRCQINWHKHFALGCYVTEFLLNKFLEKREDILNALKRANQ